MLLLPDCKMTFICGPVASGKTYLIRDWIAKDNHHVIFDGTGEFLDDEREQIWANPKALYERIKANPYCYRIVYQPGIHREEDFAWVLKAMWWIDQPKLLVCDEFHEICPVSYKTDEVEMMLRFARHDKLGFVGASQRIADVNRLYTSACRMVVLFQTNEARDLEAIDERWRCARMVQELRPLLHDEIGNVTRQIPQALVIEKGHQPYVYDFSTGTAIKKTDNEVQSRAGENEEEGSSPRTLEDDEGVNSGGEETPMGEADDQQITRSPSPGI